MINSLILLILSLSSTLSATCDGVRNLYEEAGCCNNDTSLVPSLSGVCANPKAGFNPLMPNIVMSLFGAGDNINIMDDESVFRREAGPLAKASRYLQKYEDMARGYNLTLADVIGNVHGKSDIVVLVAGPAMESFIIGETLPSGGVFSNHTGNTMLTNLVSGINSKGGRVVLCETALASFQRRMPELRKENFISGISWTAESMYDIVMYASTTHQFLQF